MDFQLKSTAFRRERAPSWYDLEQLVRRAEQRGVRDLSAEELAQLPSLYRGALGSLSVARAISLDQNVLNYLTNLAARAHILVYAAKERPTDAAWAFLSRRLPRVVRQFAPQLAVAIALLLAGVLCGYLLTRADVERYYSFVPEQMAAGRTPASTTESLRDVLYHRGTERHESLHVFAMFLFNHNAKIGMLCFSLGWLAGAPVVFLLFYNGLILGSMAALYASRGLESEFWAWVLPHGFTELLAVCLCGMAGLVFGMAVVFPGRQTRLQNLARSGRQVAQAVIGAVILFFLAALIEGIFRQRVQTESVRWLVTAGTVVLWLVYFGWVGRDERDGS